MAALTIPTIFTAVDRLSPVMQVMNKSVQTFTTKTEMGILKTERAFKKLMPSINGTTRELLAYASLTATVVGGFILSKNAVMDYETAIQSFRTIVSDLSDKDFVAYQNQVDLVASKTKRSSVEVAQSFEKIAGLNYKFAETAEGLGLVSEASIILARAARMDLGVAAENLTGIMNQFSLGADQANRTINVLAAGQSVGAATITQTAEAFVNFGSTAAGANVTLEESVGLIQTLGKYSLLGADAGTALRGSIIKLQKAGLGYKHGQFSINDALEEARKKMDKLSTAKKKDAFVTDLFGIHNITAGRILLSNVELYKDFTKAVTGTTEAQKQADINSSTLAVTLDNLKNAWINMLTSSSQAGSALSTVKSVITLVTDNLGTIVSVGAKLLLFFAAWKVSLLVLRGALVASRIIANAFFLVDMVKYIASTQGLSFATAALGVVSAELNAIWLANPVGVVLVGIAALSLAVYGLSKAFESNTVAQKVNAEVKQRALDKTIDQRVEIIMLFDALRKTTAGTREFNDVLKKIDAIQPGIVAQYNLQAGAIDKINEAERSLTQSIIKRAEAEARAELIREKIRQKLEIQSGGPSFMDSFKSFITHGQISAKGFQNERAATLDTEVKQLSEDQAKAINPKEVQNAALAQKIQLQNSSVVKIDINDPNNRTNAYSPDKWVKLKTTSTME